MLIELHSENMFLFYQTLSPLNLNPVNACGTTLDLWVAGSNPVFQSNLIVAQFGRAIKMFHINLVVKPSL